jgi:hypothetical protein
MAAATEKLRLVLDYVPCDVCLAIPTATWEDQELLCGVCARLDRTVAHKVSIREVLVVPEPAAPEEVTIAPVAAEAAASSIPEPEPEARFEPSALPVAPSLPPLPSTFTHFEDESADASPAARYDITVVAWSEEPPALAAAPPMDEPVPAPAATEVSIAEREPENGGGEADDLFGVVEEADEDLFGVASVAAQDPRADAAPGPNPGAAQAEEAFTVPREPATRVSEPTGAPVDDAWAESILSEPEPRSQPPEPIPPPQPGPEDPEPWPDPGPGPEPRPEPEEPYPEPDDERGPAEPPAEAEEDIVEVDSDAVEAVPAEAESTPGSGKAPENPSPTPVGPGEDISELDNMSRRYERRLGEEGIRSVGDLAGKNAEELAALTGIPKDFLAAWIDAANKARKP